MKPVLLLLICAAVGARQLTHVEASRVCRFHARETLTNSHISQQPLTSHEPRGGASSKLSNLRERTVPAVILVAGISFIIHYGKERGWLFLLLALTPGLFHESTMVVDHAITTSYTNKWYWFLAYSVGLTFPNAFESFPKHLSAFSSYALILAGWMEWIIRLNRNHHNANDFMAAWREMASHHMAVLVSVVPMTYAMRVVKQHGLPWALYSVALVVINDTMAYLFGIVLGKHALLPTISPKKTWEGWIGALVSTVAVSLPLAHRMGVVPKDAFVWSPIILGLFCSTIAPFGGFIASTIKRASGKKDFGNLIAGHGGLVDRLDCQLITAPFLYLFLNALNRR